jgi:hypothetical protein
MEEPEEVSEEALLGDFDHDVLCERIIKHTESLSRLANAYLEIPRLDTSPKERKQLLEVDRLVEKALDILA